MVGAGAGGMTAALVCALQGLDVLLCEKSGQVGGTTATSAGTIWVPGTRQAREAGSRTPSRTPGAISTPSSAQPPTTAAKSISPPRKDVVEYLDGNSEVKFSIYAKHPDYLVNRPGSTFAGRALAPLPFDGRLLGEDFELLRPPIGEFMALGGMMIGRDDIEPLTRPFGSLARFARPRRWCGGSDRPPVPFRGTRLLMGNALAARLFSASAQDVPIWLNASLQELTVEAAASPARSDVDGNPQRITARRGVILATGGFGGSVERLNEYVRPPLAHAVAFAGAEGDGMRIARAVGAAIEDDHESPVFWTPVSEPHGSTAAAAPIRISRSTVPSPD